MLKQDKYDYALKLESLRIYTAHECQCSCLPIDGYHFARCCCVKHGLVTPRPKSTPIPRMEFNVNPHWLIFDGRSSS